MEEQPADEEELWEILNRHSEMPCNIHLFREKREQILRTTRLRN